MFVAFDLGVWVGSILKGNTKMAYKIISSQCTACSACEPECPNVAIYEKDGTFVINPKKCTECIGYFDDAQCVAVCPVENTCVIDNNYPRYQAQA